MGQLKKWRMQIADGGACWITGFDQRGFKRTASSETYAVTEFDSDYFCVDGMKDGRHFMCRFKDICRSYPMRPTRMHKGVSGSNNLWYAINNLLAESSLYASGLSGVLDLAGLHGKYPKMYDNVDMGHIAGAVLKAVHKRDGGLRPLD